MQGKIQALFREHESRGGNTLKREGCVTVLTVALALVAEGGVVLILM